MKHFINPNHDTYTLKLIKKNDNSAYEYGKSETEHNPFIEFKGSVVNNIDKKTNRITKGVNGSSDEISVRCSNLPDIAEIGDLVVFLKKTWTIQNIATDVQSLRLVNGGVFSEKHLLDKAPKIITLG